MLTPIFKNLYWRFLLAGALLGLPSMGLAQEVEAGLKTIYLATDYGLTTHKSKLVESNDTGSTLRYGIGFNVGDSKQLGVVMQTESSSINFALNQTSTTLLYRDTRITYRMGYFYLGYVSAYAEASAAAADGSDMFSGRGSGTGYTAGAYIPVGGRSLLQIDLTSAAIADFLNKDEAVTVALGSRMDIDIVGHLPISKRYFTLDIGYRQRTQPITYNSVTTTETITSTYIGLTMGNDI